MKLGVHNYLFTEGWTDADLGVLDVCAGLGAGCFEIAIGDDRAFTLARTRAAAERLGLELIVSPGGLWPVACDLSADDPADRATGLAWHCRQVDVAAELGATAYTGALYGHPGTVQRRRPPADELPRTAAGLHRLAEYAAARQVRIVLEPMSRFRTHLAHTPQQAMDLIARADHPNLSVLFDTFHAVSEVRDYAAATAATAGRLWGLHACENDRGVPGGGLVPWDGIFAALARIGFDGYLVLETYNTGLGDFGFRRGIFRDLCPDGAAFARAGFAFLAGQLARHGLPPPQPARGEARG
jgi:D-psicose/D-tagatose/L-ribulose 3-epimerase